ncbi:MAG TPA: 23S rRNA (guanosine(2251)-2'-O)-methyltransferase RlmB [Firmicutes bacterium]|nr:23S rRNA (guanosine(2251)-2'-O)-methyltransferase RlmB [Bacillota bacterium]
MRKEDPREELIEGRNPVLEAVRAGLPLSEILVASGSRGKEIETLIALAGAGNIPVSYRERVYLDRLSKTGRHQGVIARGSLPATRSLDHLFAAAESRGETPLFLLAAGVEDPRNLGSIIRTAEVAGAHGLLMPERRAAGLSAVVARASAGALYHLPVAVVKNTVRAMEELKMRGCWLVGADMDGTPLWQETFDFTAPVCLVLGGEGKGLTRLVRETCDLLVGIPQRGKVGSLNVSVAAGIILYEVVRRRAQALP